MRHAAKLEQLKLVFVAAATLLHCPTKTRPIFEGQYLVENLYNLLSVLKVQIYQPVT